MKSSRNNLFIFSLLTVIFYTTGCSTSHDGRIAIFHTNDMHTQYVPVQATWMDTDPKPLIGGMVALESLVRQQRSIYPNSLLLDAGDLLTGTPLAKVKVNGAFGGGFVEMMNILKYDAYTVGNHEFDGGLENVPKLLASMKFDALSANMFLNNEPLTKKGYEIYKVGNLRVGIIGLMMEYLHDIVPQKKVEGVTVQDPAQTAQELIDKIDPKTDLIIILTHQGADEDFELAEKLTNADVIVGGHSHTRLDNGEMKNGILVTQAGSKTTNLGRIILDVAGDTISSYKAELLDVWVDSIVNPNTELVEMVNKYKTEIDKEYNKQIGTLLGEWTQPRRGKTGLGNFITDAFRTVTKTDFALTNSSGIRKGLQAGPITKLNIVETLPFANRLLKFECKGSDLLKLAETSALGTNEYGESSIQISGFTFEYFVDSEGNVNIKSAQINGKPVNKEATYSGVSLDFVLEGRAERYMGFVPQNLNETGLIDSDAVIEYIQRNPSITPNNEIRIKKIG